MTHHNAITDLKFKLNSGLYSAYDVKNLTVLRKFSKHFKVANEIDNILVTKRKLINDRKEYTLRVEERTLTEKLLFLSSESELIFKQTEDLKQQISQIKHHIAIIEICTASEKAKLENHSNIINHHKKGFEVLFAEEREVQNARNEELKKKQAEEEELERQKQANILEIQEQKTKEAVALEEESGAIESECCVLVKRNKAIMIQLRRKLVEAEDIRRKLMENKEKLTDNK